MQYRGITLPGVLEVVGSIPAGDSNLSIYLFLFFFLCLFVCFLVAAFSLDLKKKDLFQRSGAFPTWGKRARFEHKVLISSAISNTVLKMRSINVVKTLRSSFLRYSENSAKLKEKCM